MNNDLLDLFVIGGGVNGCGIARDAAGRGYSVALAEMNDLASGTSSAATKLVHGGLRYLEHYEFRLVHEALSEREVLWAMAPHIIWPLRFVLPHHRGLRPAFILRLGLFLYDHIGGRKKLPATKTLDLRTHETGKPLRPVYRKGFEYSDCWVNDARLVALNARDAADRGADIHVRTKVVKATRQQGHWLIDLQRRDGETFTVRARMLVNAAGPWVDHVLKDVDGPDEPHNVRLVKGSHIVVKKQFAHDKAYILQNADGRIIFAIPYEDDFTLIGTTDMDYEGDPADVAIESEEINYLCTAASEYFAHPVERSAVVWAYSGVRPLFDDGADKAQEATREYVLRLEGEAEQARLLNVFGGKLTTYRKLADHALEHVEEVLGAKGPRWTHQSHLPGGDFPTEGFDQLVRDLHKHFGFLTMQHAYRLCRLYGTRAHAILEGAQHISDLGENFGADLYAVEVDHLMDNEWAYTVEDILWRRTKLGLRLDERDIRALTAYMERKQKAA